MMKVVTLFSRELILLALEIYYSDVMVVKYDGLSWQINDLRAKETEKKN